MGRNDAAIISATDIPVWEFAQALSADVKHNNASDMDQKS